MLNDNQQGHCRHYCCLWQRQLHRVVARGKANSREYLLNLSCGSSFSRQSKQRVSHFDHCKRNTFGWYKFRFFPFFPHCPIPTFLYKPIDIDSTSPRLPSSTTCSHRSGFSAWAYSSAALLWHCSAIGPTTTIYSLLRVQPTPLSPLPNAVVTSLLETRHVPSTSAVVNMAIVALPSTSVVKAARTIAICPGSRHAPRATLHRFGLWATTSPGQRPASVRPCPLKI